MGIINEVIEAGISESEDSWSVKCKKCGTETVSNILKHWTEDIDGQGETWKDFW